MLKDYELEFHKDTIKKVEQAIREIRPRIADILKESFKAIVSHYEEEINGIKTTINDRAITKKI